MGYSDSIADTVDTVARTADTAARTAAVAVWWSAPAVVRTLAADRTLVDRILAGYTDRIVGCSQSGLAGRTLAVVGRTLAVVVDLGCSFHIQIGYRAAVVKKNQKQN